MSTYVDTSVLAKAYLEEKDSEQALRILAEAAPPIVSTLTALELRSTLKRAHQGNRLSKVQYNFLLNLADEDAAHLAAIPVDGPVLGRSLRIIDKWGLRTLDAVHLASALHAGCNAFATTDKELVKAAEGEGMAILRI